MGLTKVGYPILLVFGNDRFFFREAKLHFVRLKNVTKNILFRVHVYVVQGIKFLAIMSDGRDQ